MNHERQYLERASYTWSQDSIRIIASPTTTAKSIYFYIQEAGYFKTTPPYFTERKNLNSFLMVYTISGKGTLNYEGHTYSLTSGQCFYINCMNHHYYQCASNHSWEFLWIHFNGNNALGYYEEFSKNGFKILKFKGSSFIETTIARIISLHKKKNIHTELLSSNLIVDLLTEILIENTSNQESSIFLPDYIKDVMKEIDKNFKDELSLDYLATKYNISKFHLSKKFKKCIGITVNEYIINSRLTYAKELLKYSGLPVSEISSQSGIPNVSHFINLFKSRENITPLAYRKEWRI